MSCLFFIDSVIMCLLCLSVFCVSLCVSLFVYINVTIYTLSKEAYSVTMLLYIFVLFFVHLMMLYYMCILLYRNSLMQISPLALTNFYQSHIFFFQEIESVITMRATFTLMNANVRSSSAVL